MARRYRGVQYVIRIERNGAGNEIQLEVDGKKIEGNVIPLPEKGKKEVRVVATLR